MACVREIKTSGVGDIIAGMEVAVSEISLGVTTACDLHATKTIPIMIVRKKVVFFIVASILIFFFSGFVL
jgi:hypothetical protein